MQDIPWLTEALTVLATDGVEAAEKIIERALENATVADRVEVGSGWVEILVADGRSNEAVVLLEALIAKAPKLSTRGALSWRLARLFVSTGQVARVEAVVKEAMRLGAVSDAMRVQAAADAVAVVENAESAPDVAQAHALLLGLISRSAAPTTAHELLQLAWDHASSVGDAAHQREDHDLASWSAIVLSMISGMLDQLDGAIQLATHAGSAAVAANNAFAFSEATRSLARWVAMRDGDDAAEVVLRDAQRQWDERFSYAGPSPIAAWLDAWTKD